MTKNKPNGSFPHSRIPPPYGWEFKQERLHAFADILPQLRQLTAEMRHWGFHYTEVFGARWAIGEALHNAIKHGHRGDESKTVQLNYVISADYLVAEVIDEGPGFDPKRVPNPFAAGEQAKPGPRGLFFMGLFMSWVRFEGRGNRVTLCKMHSRTNRPDN
jgi:serine/threonine-protein kinase RsbW